MTLNKAEVLLALHLQELGLHFERQYAYAPGRRFRADFATWRDGTRPFALIEVTGGIWTHEAHSSVTGVLADNRRLYHAFVNGWPMMRVTPDEVMDGRAKELIKAAMQRLP